MDQGNTMKTIKLEDLKPYIKEPFLEEEDLKLQFKHLKL